MKTTPLPSTNQDIKFIEIKNHLNYFLKSIKKFKTYNTVYREEISEILHSISPILISPKDQETLRLKIDANQNLFNEFYLQFSGLKEYSFEEKVGLTTEEFLEYLSCTKYEGLYTSKLKVKFKSDLIEFLNLQYKDKEIEQVNYEKSISLSKFQTIFSKKEYFEKFKEVLFNNSYLDENGVLEIPKTFFGGSIIFLRNNGIIKKITNVKVVEAIKDEFNFKISKETMCIADPYPTDESEEKLFNDLSKAFKINY